MIAPSKLVAAALKDKRPIVALESTIIAHGLPYPDNLDVALELENAITALGALPATIAVFDGVIKIGLTEGELQLLAGQPDRFTKAAARELGYAVSQQRSAATTVSSTALIAAQVGIKLFATGGIGGVHRGDALDVSQDLTTLAHCGVAVVSAGAKAILDLPRTLEVLETYGVPVVGHRCTEFPAFYTRSSGLTIDMTLEHPKEHARFLKAHWALLPDRGVLIANPIPDPDALPRRTIENAIVTALDAAVLQRITGKALTPFLLKALAESTAGQSIAANRALAVNNAKLAARIAVELCDGEDSTGFGEKTTWRAGPAAAKR